MDLAELMVRVKADTADYTKGMDNMKGSTTGATAPTSKMSSALKGIASAATGALILKKLGDVVMDAGRHLSEMNRVQAQTVAALESTGGSSNMAADAILNLASDMENLTGIDQVLVQEGENMLLTFTNIKNEVGDGNDIFTQATKTMMDMSVALGQDASQSALQLGKALNDPIAGVTALQRVGVKFTDAQKEQITAMVESGDVMGAQKLILAELSKEFGGSAEAYGTTMPGAIARAKSAFGDLLEGVLVPMIPMITGLANFLRMVADRFSSLPGPVKMVIIAGGLLTVMLIGLGMIIGPIAAAMGGLGVVMGVVLGPIGLIVIGIIALIAIVILCIKYHEEIKEALIAAWDAIVGALSAAWEWIKGIAETVWNAIKDFFIAWWPVIIGVFLGPIGILGGLIYKFHDEIWAKIQAVWNAIKGFFETIWNAISGAATTAWEAISGFFEKIWNTIKKVAETIWNAIKLFFTVWWTVIKSLFTGDLGKLNEICGGAMEKIKAVFTNAWNAIKAAFDRIWSTIKSAMTTAWTAIQAPFIAAWDAIKKAFSAAWDAIKLAFDSAWRGLYHAFETALAWVRAIPGKILSALGDLGNLLYNAGKAIIQGIWNGMKAIWNKMTGWLSSLGGWIKNLKGPLTKDAMLLYGEGSAIIGGLATGMEKALPSVAKVLAGVTKSISGGVNVSVGGAKGSGPLGGTVVYATVNIYDQQGSAAGLAAADTLIRRLSGAGIRLP